MPKQKGKKGGTSGSTATPSTPSVPGPSKASKSGKTPGAAATGPKGGVAKPAARVQPGRKGKEVRIAINPVLDCAIKNLLKGRRDKPQLKAHLKAIQAHQTKYENRITKANTLTATGNASQAHAVPAHKAKVTEAIGERETTLLIIQSYNGGKGDFQMKWGFSAGTGIDQLWYSKSTDTFMIVEAKGPGAKLSDAAAKGDQMSKQWVRNSLVSVTNSKTTKPEEKADAKRMLTAMRKGPPPKVIGKVIEAQTGGGAVERGCPDKGIYHHT